MKGAEVSNPHKTPITPCDRSAVRQVDLSSGVVDGVKLVPDAGSNPAKPLFSRPIALRGSSRDIFDEFAGIFPASGKTHMAAVVHRNADPSKPKRVRVERVDLVTGQSLNVATFPSEVAALDLSSDGKWLLTRSARFGLDQGIRLDVWQVDSGAVPKHIVSFMPFENLEGSRRDFGWARFVGPDHVIVMNVDGEVGLWEFRHAKEVWSARQEWFRSAPVMSAGHRYMAIPSRAGVIIVDPMSGKALGRLPAHIGGFSVMAFKPDGRQLAISTGDHVMVWDFVSSKMLIDLSLAGTALDKAGAKTSKSPVIGCKTMEWTAEGFLLLDGIYLVSLAKQSIVWTYVADRLGMPPPLGTVCAGRYFYTTGSGHDAPWLVSVTIPDDRARANAPAANAPPAGPGSSKLTAKGIE